MLLPQFFYIRTLFLTLFFNQFASVMQNRIKIDLSNWERKDNYNFFKSFLNPTYSVTSEVNCEKAKLWAKETGHSFFLTYVYAILKAVNEIKEFRYRIQDESVYLYNEVDLFAPVKINDNGKFFTVRIPWNSDFELFHAQAGEIINAIPKDGDPYAAENNTSEADKLGVVLVSATPDLYFTSITTTQMASYGSDYPLINAGKAIHRDGHLIMPIAVSLHHGFVDGHHVGLFYKSIQSTLDHFGTTAL